MKITIERDALTRVLARLARTIERRITIPILSHIALEASGDGLHLSTTNIDMGAADTLPVDIVEPGATTVPGHILAEIVKKLPAGSLITLATSATGMTVQCGRSRFTLQTLPLDDFPALVTDDLPHRFELPCEALRRMIDKIDFAISTEETRYFLNGIYLHTASHSGSPCLRGAATDGHRLAIYDIDLPAGAADMPGIIIPRATVAEMARLVGDDKGAVRLELSSRLIRIRIDSMVLTSKLIDGTFPDYARVIPTGNDMQITAEAAVMASAVERVATICTEKGKAVRLAVAQGSITLSAKDHDAGAAQDEISAQYEGNPVEIGFNHSYLSTMLGKIDGTAQMCLRDSNSPAIFRQSSSDAALYVLMPVRI